MQKVLTAEEMREVDRLTTEKYGISSILLMENAAHAAARVIGEKLGNSVTGKSFLILCGKGNNGGDGAALARILWTQGAQVFVYLFGNIAETRGDARINFDILKKISGSKEWISRNKNCLFLAEIETAQELALILMLGKKHILIDAFFGTGLSKPVKGELEHFFMTIRRPLNDKKNSLLFSLDLPSGLSADFAKPIGLNVQADVTITFTAPKLANILPPASNFNGKLITVDIGSPYELIENSPSQLFLAERIDAQSWLERTKFSSASYKNQRGRALIVAGSKKMAGAAVLAANAAMVSGLGLVRIAKPKSARDAVASRTAPETLIAGVAETKNGAISHAALKEVFELTEKADVVAIGSGLSSDEESTKKFVREFVKKRKFPVLIDADGLNALSPFDLKGSDEFPLILTPHIGEMQRLLGIDEKADLSDRVKMVREFAGKNHVILVLKGERNLIAAPDGRVVISPTGNSGLGKAGNGDTLAGIITGFLAQAVGMKVDIFESVVAALYIAGLAGDIAAEKFGKRVMTASDVRECLVEAFKGLEEN
ncbi:MAG: NAD(P)H-hydrate dehydratase [Acidobacteria bacterium]|nr:NAD(P)H-hydrate dehydratase [Acidobacteriota bacterium]